MLTTDTPRPPTSDQARAPHRRENVARSARDEARSRRNVLIVTRTAHEAVKVLDALERAMRPRDGEPVLLRGQGLWSARSEAWGGARIDLRVQGPGVRGMSVDTLLIDRDVKRASMREAWPVTGAAAAPIVTVW